MKFNWKKLLSILLPIIISIASESSKEDTETPERSKLNASASERGVYFGSEPWFLP